MKTASTASWSSSGANPGGGPGGNPAMTPIQFCHGLWPPSREGKTIF